jgi:hypothetical protein
MGSTKQSDIPGNHHEKVIPTASVASDGADTLYQPIMYVRQNSTFKAAHWFASASQAGHGTNYRILKVVNRGSAGSGTTVVASYALTASLAANKAAAFTNSTTAANLSLTTGDVLAYVTTSAGDGVAVVAGVIQPDIQYN